jgi:hypothetical protein
MITPLPRLPQHRREWLTEASTARYEDLQVLLANYDAVPGLEAALRWHVERDHAEALEMAGPTERAMRRRGPECPCASCRDQWPEVHAALAAEAGR